MQPGLQESYFDFSTLGKLKYQSKNDAKAALKTVAGEFESIFLKMMLKSMRDASFGNPLFDSDSAKFYRDMYDDQLSNNLAKQGGVGLADMIVKQLEQYVPENNPQTSVIKPVSLNRSRPSQVIQKQETDIIRTPQQFVKELWPHANRAAEEIGVSPKVLIAQAALETGWGKYIVRKDNGQNSFNLFNIKSDHRWDGDEAQITTVEYSAGRPNSIKANFRVYGSYQESFEDYVNFLKSSPRYAHALKGEGGDEKFVETLQKSGYATDPDYAKKVKRVLNDKPLNDALVNLKYVNEEI